MRTGVNGEGPWFLWVKGWTRPFSVFKKSFPKGRLAKGPTDQGVFMAVANSAPSCNSMSAQRAFSPKCS